MADFTIKDAITIRDDILRTIKNGLLARGVVDPQVGPGSDYFVLATAVANEFAVVGANTQVKADAQMPDSASGADLDRLSAMFGLARNPAAKSSGSVIITTSASTFIAVGTQLVDQAGLRYEVTLGGVYTNTSPSNVVPIQSVDTGRHTNHVADDILRWTSQPPYVNAITLVESHGLNGGLDAELDEDLRARLLSRLQNPPNNCNWNQIADIAEKSHTAVQKAFVYPAANGPSTVHVAVTQAPQVLSPSITALVPTSKQRTVDPTLMTSTIRPYIQGQLPEYVESIITSVVDVINDVSIALSLPSSPSAQPAGPGGGWLDGATWPKNTASSPTFTCTVTALSADPTRTFTVDAPSAPQAGVSHICFLSPQDWKLYRAKVLTFTGAPGAYVITIDTPFLGIATGNYIFPDAVNMQTYSDAFIAAFGLMGPGEKTTSAGNISRAYRHPLPVNSWQYTLNATQLRVISDSAKEVLDISYLFRTSSTAPAVPGAVATAPNIFVPNNIGFYELV